jgi:hypothetical protein
VRPAEGDQRPVFCVAEMMRLADMAVADQKSACAALARVKRAVPGAQLVVAEALDA